MVFWTVIIFIIGLLGLVHEAFLINYSIPLFGEATSVCIMLVALGMFCSLKKEGSKVKT